MNLKKLTVLAGMAMALIAFAIPASASAEWLTNGTPISEDTTVTAAGTAQFNTLLGGVHCEEATATFILTAGTTTGHVEGFHADHDSNCHGSGSLANCTVSKTELTQGTAPILHATGTDIVVTEVALWAEYETTEGAPEECAVEETELDFKGEQYITVEVDPNQNEIETLTLSSPKGGILTAFGLEIEGVEVEGDLTIEEPHHGVIGFES